MTFLRVLQSTHSSREWLGLFSRAPSFPFDRCLPHVPAFHNGPRRSRQLHLQRLQTRLHSLVRNRGSRRVECPAPQPLMSCGISMAPLWHILPRNGRLYSGSVLSLTSRDRYYFITSTCDHPSGVLLIVFVFDSYFYICITVCLVIVSSRIDDGVSYVSSLGLFRPW